MKKSSKIFVGASAALLAAFAAKNIIDYSRYTTTVNSAPFDVAISVNALFLVLPAVLLAAIAFYRERKTPLLAICAAVFATISIEETARQITVNRLSLSDGLLMAIPYIAAAAVFAVFMTICLVKSGGEKTPSMVLLGLSGLITVWFVIDCIFWIINRQARDNIMQLFAGFFFYAVYFLIPAAILAETALFLHGRTVLLIICAVISVLLAALMLVLRAFWIQTVLALISAAVCVVFAVKSKKRGKT